MTTKIVDIKIMRTAADQVVDKLKILANPDRLLLLCQLSQGEQCVSDLEQLLDIHQPTLSQQLGILRNESVVATRREGKRIYYNIIDQELLQVIATLYKIYCPVEPKHDN